MAIVNRILLLYFYDIIEQIKQDFYEEKCYTYR